MSAQTPIPFGPDEHRLPNGGCMKKVDVYGWIIVDKPGQFVMVSKHAINIDHSYQRKHINNSRVLRIASKFSWYKFGVLIVFRRKDGTLWCSDGQHRLLAALKRSDVECVPCLIFDCDDRVAEASGFLGINGDRGAVQTIDKFNALLISRDPHAIDVTAMIEASGYEISRVGRQNTVRCIAAIYNAAKLDFAAAQTAWKLCVELFRPNPPNDRVYVGLFTLERAMSRAGCGSLADAKNHRALMKAGVSGLIESVRLTTQLRKAGGSRVAAEAVASVVNKGRRTQCVPNMAPGANAEEHDGE